ncbi:uncharacterized protein LOC113127293 isoform X1 [Mastacembelus armatus]|uniref:RNA binding motif protein 43 n=1 Tax=Mastacembelus armatus TaxID=205130 RepID=A0A3Q3RPX4_9TELE|nr:RNA-binding protein 43 isoform X1 [Mastacembelus armatus]
MESGSWDESRTVVVSGVIDVLPVSRMIDKLTIHFQSPKRSRGGDVEVVTYPTNMKGVAFVTFDKAEDAKRVVGKEQQVMMDRRFPEDYRLTVFPFTRDVFLYVLSATLDLSVFGSDQVSLIQSLQSTHRSVHFQPLLHQRKATIQGPFSAIKALREDLVHRASQLKSTAPTAAVKLRESRLNPRLISRPELAGCSGSQAKREAEGANSLLMPLRKISEAGEVKRLLSTALTKNWQTMGRLYGTDTDIEKEMNAWSTDRRPERAKASPTPVFRGEINAGIRSSSADRDLVPAEKISAKQPAIDHFTPEHARPDRISATNTRTWNHLGSHYSRTDHVRKSHRSSSADTSKQLKIRFKDALISSECDTEATDDPSAVCLPVPDSECTWIDTYILKYIQRFDKKEFDRCLRGFDVSEYVEQNDLVRICLTAKQSSKAASGIQQALENLKRLEEQWLKILRVQQIDYHKGDQSQRQKLDKICKDVNIIYDDVLYMREDLCIKVVGPYVSTCLFCVSVNERLRSGNR